MKNPYLRLAALVSIAILLQQRAAAADGPMNRVQVTPALLGELAEEARTNRPSLHASESRVRAAQADREAVRTWEDPMFSVGGVTATRMAVRRAEEGDLTYRLEQKLPLWGRPRLARQIADAATDREQAQADYELQMIRLDIARQVFAIALADRAVQIGTEDLDWLETMTKVATERYRVAAGSQVEVLRMQNERAQRAERLRTDTLQRDQERAQLNRLLGRAIESPWSGFDLPAAAAPVEFNDRLRRLTLTYEARLKVLRQEVRRAEAETRLTGKKTLPEVSLGVEGRQFSGSGEFRESMATITLNLPWLNRDKYRKDIERDREKLRAAEKEVADYELFVPMEARRIVTRAEAARRMAVLYRDEIIPRGELALKSAHAAWTENRGLFLDMMEARRVWLEARLEYARAVADQYTMLSELTLCCGAADLESLQMLAAPPASTPASTANPR
jgi:outer membrane protein TolC